MNWRIKASCVCAVFMLSLPRSAAADPQDQPTTEAPAAQPELDARLLEAQAIIDAVLEHHVDPPTRQELWLAGAKALLAKGGVRHRGGLSAEISQLTAPEQFAAFTKRLLADEADFKAERLPQQLMPALLDGILQAVPGGAQLIPRKELAVQKQFQGNRYIGTGIALGFEQEKQYARIAAVIPGGPMERAGGRQGDLILKIDDHDAKGVTQEKVIDLLRGEEGTHVILLVGPSADESRTIDVTRGHVVLETLSGLRKANDGQWDYRVEPWLPVCCVTLRQINGSTVHDLRKLERQFQADGVQGVILDLRSVHADDLHHTLLLADALMDGGPIGRVHTGRDVREIRADRECLFRDWPLTLLVDRETRGGGEWIAAALQDNHAAVVVGEPTAGFAFVRTYVSLRGNDGALHLNTGVFERPSGQPLQKIENPNGLRIADGDEGQAAWGVIPDLPKPVSPKPGFEHQVGGRRRPMPGGRRVEKMEEADMMRIAVRELRMRIDAGEGRTHR